MKLHAQKAVYSYFSPEVRQLMKRSRGALSSSLYRHLTPAKSLIKLRGLFSPELELTETEGKIDLDRLHEPVLERVTNLYSQTISGLDGFGLRYTTCGSSEGIFHLLARLKTEGINYIYVLKGEYEGFSAYASHLGIEAIEVDINSLDIADTKPGVWFISNPSARNGDLLPRGVVRKLCEKGHRVVLDLAYLGLTAPVRLDLSHPNIIAVVFSLSKPFGLFRFRIGYLYTRSEVPSLYANRWFKDIGRHLQGLYVLETLGLDRLYTRYRLVQQQIVDALRNNFQVPFVASDSLLIAQLSFDKCPPHLQEQFRPYLRHKTYRFCLTPYFEQIEQSSQLSTSSVYSGTYAGH